MARMIEQMAVSAFHYALIEQTDRLRGLTAPLSADPDAGAEYQIATGEIDRREIEEITLNEWREKIAKSWEVFRFE